jgi:hypothetical protein
MSRSKPWSGLVGNATPIQGGEIVARAAIDYERILQSPLGEVRAIDLLNAIAHAKLGRDHLHVIADKKKYELWIEEVQVERIPVGILIEKIRGEKKKVELEPTPDLSDRINPGIYERLVEDVAARVEAKLGGGR